MSLNISYNQSRICASETERIGKEGIEVLVYQCRRDKELRRIFIRILEIQVGCDKVILHHQDGVDDLAGSCHPHLVTCLRLGTGHLNTLISKDIENSLGLIGIAHMGRRRVSIDITDFLFADACAADCHFERAARTFDVR